MRVRIPLQLLVNNKKGENMVYIIVGSSAIAIAALVRYLFKQSENDARNLQSWERK